MYQNALLVATFALSLIQVAFAASRTSPPSGALVVRSGTTTSGEYKTVASAVAALPNDSTSQVIFIYPGTYNEQVYITRTGPLTVYGYTADTFSYSANQVTIQASADATSAGGDDPSGTVRVHKDDFKIYNVNIKNNYGKGSQAIAFSQYGTRVGVYACGLYGYQDTLLAEQGAQVYLKSFIQGATDFIFGQRGAAYFAKNTISVIGPGWVTASGRDSADSTMYVFENNNVVLSSSAASGTSGSVYLGRPWYPYARVIFKNTVITAPLNSAVWSTWDSTSSVTNVFFADYNSTGSGISGASRPSWVKTLTAAQAATYNIVSAAGADYASWVDTSYL